MKRCGSAAADARVVRLWHESEGRVRGEIRMSCQTLSLRNCLIALSVRIRIRENTNFPRQSAAVTSDSPHATRRTLTHSMMRSCLLIAAALFSALPDHDCRHNFVQRLNMDDGQVLVRVHFQNRTAAETSFAGYRLLEIANQNTFVRIWYKGSEIIDCGFESEPEAIENFLQDFYADVDGKNLCSPNDSCPAVKEKVTKVIEGNEELPHDVANMMRNEILVEKCTQFHERGLSGSRRAKRDLLFPGTNWCGSGNNAVVQDKNMQLGVHAAADHCCREHDNCRHYISPFSWKYNLFNYRFHTVSHCRCDERFRSCLKNARTSTANMIGKLFFNIGKTKCFRFKREKVCKKRSWWGTCLKKGRVRKAFFKNGFPF